MNFIEKSLEDMTVVSIL